MNNIPLSTEQVYEQLAIAPQWVVERDRIYRDFRFDTFSEVIAFVNKVATIAEQQDHHPNLFLHEYHFLRIECYSHIVDGLTQKDVQLALAIDRASAERGNRLDDTHA